MITTTKLYKHFNSLEVLKSIEFKIHEGEIVGLLGPNGAGKTTTLRIIAGVLPPSSGSVLIDGNDPIEKSDIRLTIGYLPENNPLYEDVTVEEWLKYWGKIKKSSHNSQEINEVVEKIGLQSVYYRLIGELSKGFRQRVGLAQAMMGNPKILILDEPSEGLDPNQRSEIHRLIREIGQKRTVIISSHVLGEITKMCNRLMILHQGKIVADGTPEELTAQAGGQQLIEVEIQGRAIITGLKTIHGVKDVLDLGDNHYQISVSSNKDLRLEIFKLAKTKSWDLYELTRKQVDLDEVFEKLTR